ncbi:MAG: membrane protein insertion efficiency factor YidD [Terriglobales bacterium]
MIVGVLGIYKRWISPSLSPACRFQPTCSEYAMEAVERHGVLVGAIFSLWRLVRCNPFAKAGYDPVPRERSSVVGHDSSVNRCRPVTTYN